MIKGSLHNYNDELDKFVKEMKEKMLLRKDKHLDNEVTSTDDVKTHLIEEILETFNLRGVTKGYLIRDFLLEAKIDKEELKDVAILCWGLKLSIDDDNEPEEYCKYTKIKGKHHDIVRICKQNNEECVKLYPCAFWIAYNKEVS